MVREFIWMHLSIFYPKSGNSAYSFIQVKNGLLISFDFPRSSIIHFHSRKMFRAYFNRISWLVWRNIFHTVLYGLSRFRAATWALELAAVLCYATSITAVSILLIMCRSTDFILSLVELLKNQFFQTSQAFHLNYSLSKDPSFLYIFRAF